ncbi:hypothetical protein [Streptomyces sp. 1331.2]|uniref:hypothetical protein n=1 Tax=Streptomyces sp. 1331.2 TaxID=1938835 RepID=UPI000BCD3845|nr:hypothetical protein [Streptomyces sp. 1331.2]SOB84032.1 hypothetical protein SAMN06272789_4263 [Streptomyces sp. 1331.2]
MRAIHATKPQEAALRGGSGGRRGIARRLPRPRAVAAGGALLAQLWGLGAAGAYAVAADPLREPARPAVRHVPHGTPLLGSPALGRPALDGQSAERPVGQGQSAAGTPDRSPGSVGVPADGGPLEGTAGAIGGSLQERIRAGGLPLPGQPAAVPDAFAIASGLTGTVPAQRPSAESNPAQEVAPTGLPATGHLHPGTTRSADPRRAGSTEAPPVPAEAAGATDTATAGTVGHDGAAAIPVAAVSPGGDGTPETLAIADTATVTPATDGSATATAVLAPIAAGLLLTGAAMCKHRGLPRGH